MSVGGNSQLVINGNMTQRAGSSLETSFSAIKSAVVATSITLDGMLKLSGSPVSASSVINKTLTVLHTTAPNAISGDFSSLSFSRPADYVTISGLKTNNNTDYNIKSGLTWLATPDLADGVFTLPTATDNFDLDVELNDQTGPFASGWDGKTLIKNGSGTLFLSRQNSWTGVTLINDGVLQSNIADAFAVSSELFIGSSGTFKLNNYDQTISNLNGAGLIDLGSARLTINSQQDTLYSGQITGNGSLVKNNSGILTLSGNSLWSGGMQLNGGELIATMGNALGTGNINNNAALTFNFGSLSKVSNFLSGNGVLTKTGAGTSMLTRDGSSAGLVNVLQGTFALGPRVGINSTGDFNTQQNAVTSTGIAAHIHVADQFDMQGTLSLLPGSVEPIVTANNVVLGSSSSLNIAGLTFNDNLEESQWGEQTFQIIHTAAPGDISGDFSGVRIANLTSPVDFLDVSGYKDVLNQNYNVNTRLTWYAGHTSTPEKADGTFTLPTADSSFDLNVILRDEPANTTKNWDGKTLTKKGNGTLILSRHNLYSGETIVNAGTLQTGIENAFSSSRKLNIAQGAMIRFEGYDQWIHNLSGLGNIDLGTARLTLNNSDDNIFTGVISGEGSVAKNGEGALTFLNNQSWTGTTTITDGSLVMGNPSGKSITLNSANILVNPGATLGGYGEIAGNVYNAGTFAVADALPSFANGPAGNIIINGNMVNAGNIIMASPVPASSLIIKGDYQGNNGLMTLSTVLGDDDSKTDKLVIKGNSTGNTRVAINNHGGAGARTQKGIEIISVSGESTGRFSLVNRVVAGSHEYFLLQGLPDAKNGNWYLRSQLPPTPPEPPQPPSPQKHIMRPEVGSYLANQLIASQIFNQRLENRNPTAKDSSLWLRQAGSRTGFYDNSGQLKNSANSYLVQGGGEIAAGQFTQNDRLHIGVMTGYAHSSSNTVSQSSGARSEGQINGYSGGFYGTWYQNDLSREGSYIDSWVQYSTFNAQTRGNGLPAENYNIKGFSGSVESGFKLSLRRGEFTSTYLTPQAQLILNGIGADDHTEKNGTVVTSENNVVLQSRLGVKISHEGSSVRDKSRGRSFKLYTAANWIYNNHEQNIAFNNEGTASAGTKNAGELKLGLEGNMSENLSVWGHVAQVMGGEGYHSTDGQIGVSYYF